MDRMIYTAMTGAQHILDQQATVSNNLANATTTGFRAQIDSFRAVPVVNGGMDTRAFVVNATSGTDFTPGPIQQTGRTLDMAIEGKGWFAVQRPDGTEGYTRNGSFKVNENGMLQTTSGLNVVGGGGPISIPPGVILSVGNDGTLSSVVEGNVPGPSTQIDQLKLVNPPEANMVRGEDGLFTVSGGQAVDVDPRAKVVSGALEGSNVNLVHAMVSMVSLARQFDTQMKLLQSAKENDEKASQLYSLT